MGTATKQRTEPVRMGRPPVGPRTQLRLQPEQMERLDRLAAERGTTRSALIREAVDATYGTDDETP